MTDESEIVKELREAERLGILQSKVQSTYEKLDMQEESLNETPDKSIYITEDSNKRTRDDCELGDLEEKYRSIFENYAIGITLADDKEHIVSWNKYTEELLNKTQNELYLKPVSSLYPPEEWQKIRTENVRQKGIKYSIETRMIRKNQGCLNVELFLCVLKGKGGKTVGSIGIIKDITKLKETDRELKKSEERYRTIFENSAVAITLTDENERIISWNKFTEDLLGMDKEDLYLKPVELLYPADEWQKIRAENIRKKGLQHHLETRMVNKNNEIINVSLSLSVLKNHEGKVIGSIGVTRDITERKKIGRALEISEKKFKQLYEQAPVPYHTLSPAGIITDVNKKWCQILGYTKEKVVGRLIFDFVKENEREVAKSSFNNKIQDKKSYTGGNERTFIAKNEKEKIFVIHDFFSYDKDDKISSVQTIMEEITERKKIEGELRESEEKFRDLFENANDLIQSVDNSGSFVYVNKKWLKTLGYSKNELKKLKITDILRKDHIPHFMEIFKKVCEGKAFENIEVVLVSKNGKEIYVEGNVNPRFKDGEFIATRGIFRDITDRKQAEELLKKSEDKFRNLAEYSPNMIFINKKGKVVYANRKCQEIMGYKREEFYSPNFDFLTLIAQECKELVKTAFRKHMNDEENAPYEYKLITKDGKKIEAIITTKLIKYEEDNAILGIVTVITEQKKTEESLRKANRNIAKLNQELEQKVEARTADVQKLLKQKNEFIGQLGHDLKTPLSVLMNVLPMIQDEIEKPDIKEDCKVAIRNADY
ncbi:MAG: PAS domain S-box protein, partial [Thermoplasmatales archaeon]